MIRYAGIPPARQHVVIFKRCIVMLSTTLPTTGVLNQVATATKANVDLFGMSKNPIVSRYLFCLKYMNFRHWLLWCYEKSWHCCLYHECIFPSKPKFYWSASSFVYTEISCIGSWINNPIHWFLCGGGGGGDTVTSNSGVRALRAEFYSFGNPAGFNDLEDMAI